MSTPKLSCRIPADWVGDLSQCLFDWQTLEGGNLALAAAGLSIVFLRRQITQSDRQHREEIERRHRAARMSMPLALAAISELTQNVADTLADRFEKAGNNEFDAAVDELLDAHPLKLGFEPVEISREITSAFGIFIETLDDGTNARHVAELIASLQIMIARFNGFKVSQAAADLGMINLMIDVAKVRFLTESIYNYARFVDDAAFGVVGVISIDNAWDSILRCANGLIFSRQRPEHFFQPFSEAIGVKKKNRQSPWNEKFEI
ncbi:hypothetical protein [Blastomonas sp. UPD001]|jgi:hypothetical protein|uniref:hypothetical protein n=1 Tax=Blastomonas sp. UPD001 TaxID=2217673 RepID=UPI0013003D5F|nr:hypothetical protein [Blastomonas sp. UPD001]